MITAIPAELREAAGKAKHAAHRADPATHAPDACPHHVHNIAGQHVYNPLCYGCTLHPCHRCDDRCRDWPDLTEAQREAFRASQDAGLSVVWPVLAEVSGALRGLGCGAGDTRESKARLAVEVPSGPDASPDVATMRPFLLRAGDVVLARLAALGVK